MSFTISDLVVETVEKAGVRRVYGLPGDSLNGLTDALRRNGNLAWEHVRHEEAAAFAAAAEAAITGVHEQVVALARALQAPIAHSLRARSSWSTTTRTTSA